MAAITNGQQSDFHWTPAHLAFSIFLGVAATVGLWLSAGLLLMLFLM